MRHALTRPQGFRWVVLVAGLSAAQVGCQPAKANPEDLQAKFVAAALSPAGAERDRALAKILPDGKIEEWTGTLDTVARNSTGRFHVAIEVAEGVRLSTLIQGGGGTLIGKNDPLYDTLDGLQRGRRVRFSAELAKKPDGGFVVLDYATGGAIGRGAYLFRLTAIAPLS
ncbi:MAG: hypothetical protein KC466_18670 [Myxococcales bacterium]|nr:hypothetical protein [Myxococcales bacterium]